MSERPVRVQVLVDGREIHTFMAEKIASSQSKERLVLTADAWHPGWLEIPDNPFFGVTDERADGIERLFKEDSCPGT